MSQKLLKRKFYKISHSLHGDKLNHFLKAQPYFQNLDTSQQLKYIKSLSNSYKKISTIYSSDCDPLNSIENIANLLEKDNSLPELIVKIDRLLTIGLTDNTQTKAKDSKPYPKRKQSMIHTYFIDKNLTKDIELHNKKILQIFSELSHFSKIPSKRSIITLNFSNKLISWIKNGHIPQESCYYLNKKMNLLIKNYHDFSNDFFQIDNHKDVQVYYNSLISKFLTILFVTVISNQNKFIQDAKTLRAIKTSYKNFGFTTKFFSEKYKSKIFSPKDISQVNKILRDL